MEPQKDREADKIVDKAEPLAKASKTLQAEISVTERSAHQKTERAAQDPETKRLKGIGTGSAVFGPYKIDEEIRCGKKGDTVVVLNNRVPEKIRTADESWARDSKDPSIWHVQIGKENFELKADVRVKEDTLTAKVKYENGREVTYTNGEPSKIVHPNGEVWTADPNHPGKWEVTKPNKDDPKHPHHTTIENVKVDTATGDIKWHVDRGAGKDHDREITEKNEYRDFKNGLSTIPNERNLHQEDKTPHAEAPHASADRDHKAEIADKGDRPPSIEESPKTRLRDVDHKRAEEEARKAAPHVTAHDLNIPPRQNPPGADALPVQRGAVLSPEKAHAAENLTRSPELEAKAPTITSLNDWLTKDGNTLAQQVETITPNGGLMMLGPLDYPMVANSMQYKDPDGYFDVFTHASAHDLHMYYGGHQGRKEYSVEVLAEIIKKHIKPGQPVRLLGCESAMDGEGGIAHQLAKLLPNNPVYAPNGYCQLKDGKATVLLKKPSEMPPGVEPPHGEFVRVKP